jgi:SAM-dependent methyltransferase
MSDEILIAEEGGFDAILARLTMEVERGEAGQVPRPDGDTVALRRREADDLWAVTAERSFLYRPTPLGRLRGLALVPLKLVLRKLMRWYVEPVAADQRRFNAAVLRLTDALVERLHALVERQDALAERQDASRDALEQRLDAGLDDLEHRVGEIAARAVELEERLTRFERRSRGAAPAVAASGAPSTVGARPPLPDYFAFESRMRGSAEAIRERQRPYVDDFRDAAPVLDLGCGRGEFLALLKEAGVEARGVDLDRDMVAYARGEGLDVVEEGAVEHLERLENGVLGGIFAAQLVEHLPTPALVRLLELAAAKLRPGGLFVAETINPLSPLALRNYYADLTHAQPVVPETLELLARQAGFDRVELRYLNEPEERLAEPADPVISANVRRLNELLFGPLDYAIVART